MKPSISGPQVPVTVKIDELRRRATIQEWQFQSRLPLVGPLVVSIRQMLHGLAGKWALRSVSQQQSEFNLSVLDIIERAVTDEPTTSDGDLRRPGRLKSRLDYLEGEAIYADRSILQLRRLCAQLSIGMRGETESAAEFRMGMTALRVEIDDLANRVRKIEPWAEEIRTCIAALQLRFADLTNQVTEADREIRDTREMLLRESARQEELLALVGTMRSDRREDGRPIETGRPDTRVASSRSSPDSYFDYFLFELLYRGSDNEITQRHERYLAYFEPTDIVIDLGCGRGEFLKLLRQRDIEAHGVDADPDMVDSCRQWGLDVEQGDILEYLSKVGDNSVDGVFLGQVVEHLPPPVLVQLIRIAHQKLKPEGRFIAETINPTCLYALTTHYLMDMSHIRPVHPELLSFLLRTAGFRVDPPLFFEPVPDPSRLQRLRCQDLGTKAELPWVDTLNQNVDLLNNFLYGNQDYAVIARKIAWPRRMTAIPATSEILRTR